MVDMNTEMYRCCGYTVEVSGSPVEPAGGRNGHRVYCEMCGETFEVPGDIEIAKRAIPTHFLAKHRLEGQLEDWHP